MTPELGFRARGVVHARLAHALAWCVGLYLTRVLPHLPARWRTLGSWSLDSLPEEARTTMRRDGLLPAPELVQGPAVRPMALPLGATGWLVTGYDEVRTVLADSRTFSNDFGHVIGRPGIGRELDPGGLGTSDPPYHTQLRRILAPEFTAHRLRSRMPRVQAIVEAQLDVLERESDDRGRIDLVAHFARPIPWLVICDLLGISERERARLLSLRDDRFDLGGGIIGPLTTMTGWTEHLCEMVARARADPQPGLLGRLSKASERDLDDHQVAGVLDGLITGGLETTASMLALGALVLVDEPQSRAVLADSAAPSDRVVDELLRRLTVVQVAFPRFARADSQLGGATVATHDVLICSLSAANHELGGTAAPHLAFGHGLHRCVGAELARIELETAWTGLVTRFPDLHTTVPTEELAFHPHSAVFGLRELPVQLGGRRRRDSVEH